VQSNLFQLIFDLTTIDDDVNTIVWISLEENIGLISMNLPALGKLFKIAQDKLSSSMRSLLSRSGGKTATSGEGYYSSTGARGTKVTEKSGSIIEMVNKSEKSSNISRERSRDDSYDFNTVEVKGHVRHGVSPA
jgi:hypothetical protein